MKRIAIVYGAIAGTVIIGSIILSLSLSGFESSASTMEWLGYLIMIMALSVIFVGIKRYRDQDLGGIIKFGTALKAGLGITVVASLIYVVAWELNLVFTDYAFIGEYTEAVIEERKAEGLSGQALKELEMEMENMTAQYAKAWFRLPITFMEIFPVGLLISIISAAILRKSEVLPAVET